MNIVLFPTMLLIVFLFPMRSSNRIKNARFKLLVCLVSLILSLFFGDWFANTFLSLIKKINFSGFDSSGIFAVAAFFAPSLGAIVAFVLIFLIIRLLTNYSKGGTNGNLRAIVQDRLLGALDGLFTVVGYSVTLKRYVLMSLAQIKSFNEEIHKTVVSNDNKRIKFVANLN